ncbi:hypothetical protein GCM10027451_40080 [Geodermatophilus aquaeductus]|uniref:Regulatory protein, lacI family n=1 Tax=Geodermatophilus aquaeductus TaxID=1564161 RepID=A0A521FPC9_9ACTN|nr:regulatory protein, lacI family [Geodermatophilus aquaeductus]
MRDDPPPSVTLEHVARAAGVSRATVSRVVSGTGPVSATTVHRVRAAAEETLFFPSELVVRRSA